MSFWGRRAGGLVTWAPTVGIKVFEVFTLRLSFCFCIVYACMAYAGLIGCSEAMLVELILCLSMTLLNLDRSAFKQGSTVLRVFVDWYEFLVDFANLPKYASRCIYGLWGEMAVEPKNLLVIERDFSTWLSKISLCDW